MKLDIKSALKEIESKTEEDIEKSAGMNWAAKAGACYFLVTKAKNSLEKVKWLLRAEDNRHEALEHSALIGDGGKFLSELQNELDKHRTAALKSITS